jgi:hypothetical protein
VDDNNRISANLLSNLSKDDNNRISANLLSNLSNITNITKTFQKDKTQKNITMTLTKQPKYNSTSNIQIFFELYDRAAVINGWNDEAKLQHIHNSFKGKLQEWVVSSTFADWASSKIALKEKQAISTKDDIYYLNKLMQIKRKNCSSLNKFISKFDEVRQSVKPMHQLTLKQLLKLHLLKRTQKGFMSICLSRTAHQLMFEDISNNKLQLNSMNCTNWLEHTKMKIHLTNRDLLTLMMKMMVTLQMKNVSSRRNVLNQASFNQKLQVSAKQMVLKQLS